MPQIDLSILNQRQTPAFYADTLANRPAAGFIGRIFVSTNTFELYRDNGTGWDLIGGPGAGTVTGSGAAGQVAFWNAASTITGSNDLFWDNVNGHLGIGTITPGTALDVKHDQNTVVQLEQSVATNDNRIAFINNGVGLWRLGAFYNAGANDFGLFDIVNSAARVTVKNTGQTFIGPQQSSSGKLVVVATARDNGIILIGTDAPGFRINDGTEQRQVGIAMSTGANDFIQGSVNRDFCIFNASKAAPSPMLFGIHDTVSNFVVEAARISPARNFLIGTTTDNGQKLQVNGSVLITGATTYNNLVSISTNDLSLSLNRATGTPAILELKTAGVSRGFIGADVSTPFQVYNESGNVKLTLTSAGNLGIGLVSPNSLLHIQDSTATTSTITPYSIFGATKQMLFSFISDGTNITNGRIRTGGNTPLSLGTSSSNDALWINNNGNVCIGTTTDAGQRLQVIGNAGIGTGGSSIVRLYIQGVDTTSTNFSLYSTDSNGNILIATRNDGLINSGTRTLSPYNYSTTGRSMVVEATGNIGYLVSTRESKTNINTLNNSNILNQLNPVSFNYRKKDNLNNNFTDDIYEDLSYGFIADEVEKIDNNLVFYNILKDGNKKLAGVEYNKIIALLVKGIQELNTKIENLKN